MIELPRTTDAVPTSWISALPADAGIDAVVLDTHTAILEGSIGVLPRRLAVSAADGAAAGRILAEAGVGLPP